MDTDITRPESARPGARPAADTEPLDRRLLAVALVVVLGMAMTGLDMTAVNVALQRLSGEFGASITTVQWVATAYTLALAAVIPVTAWAIGRFGTRRLYFVSVGAFLAGSVLCGLAWSVESLIVFRVVQGIGGGMIMPVGMTIMTRRAAGQVPRIMAIVGVPMQLGPMLGPLVGGWLVDAASWRWIFYLNLPFAALALVLASRLLDHGDAQPGKPLDGVGLMLLSPGLSALLYGLTTGAHRGDFGSPSTALPTAGGAVLAAAFVVHALRSRNPLIDLRLLRRPSVRASGAALVLFMCGFFGMLLLAPLYFQTVRGQSAMATGLLMLPQGVGTMATMPVCGRLLPRVGPRRLLLVGLSLSVAGLGAFAVQVGAGADAPVWGLGAALFVTGAGLGFTMMPTMSSAVSGLLPEEVPAASTLLAITQQVGASFGTAFLSLILARSLSGQAAADAPDAFQIGYAAGIAILLLALLPATRVARSLTPG